MQVIPESTRSITRLIADLKRGKRSATANLWQHYYARLVRLASKRLGEMAGRYVDEEDIAIQGFASLCRAVEEGRVPNLHDRHDLWRLLVHIVERKVINQRRHLRFAKNRAVHETALAAANDQCRLDDFEAIGPTPQEAIVFQEEVDALIATLDDPNHVQICLLKLDGHTNQEIAMTLGCAMTSVERKLRMIRGHLKEILSARSELA